MTVDVSAADAYYHSGDPDLVLVGPDLGGRRSEDGSDLITPPPTEEPDLERERDVRQPERDERQPDHEVG
jgi:hypothetical protein